MCRDSFLAKRTVRQPRNDPCALTHTRDHQEPNGSSSSIKAQQTTKATRAQTFSTKLRFPSGRPSRTPSDVCAHDGVVCTQFDLREGGCNAPSRLCRPTHACRNCRCLPPALHATPRRVLTSLRRTQVDSNRDGCTKAVTNHAAPESPPSIQQPCSSPSSCHLPPPVDVWLYVCAKDGCGGCACEFWISMCMCMCMYVRIHVNVWMYGCMQACV